MDDLRKVILNADELMTNAVPCKPLLTEQDHEELIQKFHQIDIKNAQDWSYLAGKVVGFEGDYR